MDFSTPPPPYREVDCNPCSSNGNINKNQFRVPRKPVRTERPRTAPSRNQNAPPPIYFEEFERLKQSRLQTPPAPAPLPIQVPTALQELSLNTTTPHSNITASPLYYSPAATDPFSRNPSPSSGVFPLSTVRSSSNASSISNAIPQSSQSSNSSFIQEAFREARHFAGGLITHPVESTKHFTILRHSHGLVFYQGAKTTLAVSIFSDQPLPPERTIWLQSKGWSGTAGMRARAFMGRNGNWINVTPSLNVGPEQLKATDERAWQRDIANFRKKPKSSKQQYHILRETAIVRIPEEAEDGYFQLVLCLGDRKKVLCPSPVFRILSSSTSPGSLRGASLTTLPLELGVIAFGTYARNTAGRVVGPVASVIQNRVQKLMPSWVAQQATPAAYGVMKPSDKQANQGQGGSTFGPGTSEITLEAGPQTPYPLRFIANSEPAVTGVEQFNMPGMALTGIPANIVQGLSGYYLGWARFLRQPTTGNTKASNDTWYQAVFSALPISLQTPENRNIIVRLTRDYEGWSPERRVIEVRIMGFIRPDDPLQRDGLRRGLQARDSEAAEAVMLAEMNDILLAENILDQPAWHPDAVPPISAQPGTSGGQSFRMAAQRQIGKVPFHKFGVRSPIDGDGVRDTLVTSNGYFVRR
ncbi:hypothetical protein ONS95_008895 [Cadophora gregata]|uniref:uncharacterized protein n=1 Tax=Cadophora gregata TaxID=51156 RepID=UPI0026DB89DA|nr:uncharacterized protein ONS95_008895 [Cadophora gregata]KAK0123903.1 hypothetical protein ONS95_008895 [Cadophora gregata]